MEAIAHHVIDIAPDRPRLSDESRSAIKALACDAEKAFRFTDVIDSSRTQKWVHGSLTAIANKLDTKLLGLDSYPHRLLNGLDIALLDAREDPRHDVDQYLNEFSVTPECERRFPRLGDLALKALAHDPLPNAIGLILGKNIPDSPGSSGESRRKDVQLLVHRLRERESAGFSGGSGTDGAYSDALSEIFREKGLNRCRDAVIDYYVKMLHKRRHEAMASAAKEIKATLPLMALTAVGILFSKAAIAQSALYAAALHDRASCFTDEISSCPVVPVTRTAMGPLTACADAAEAECNQRILLPDSDGTKYVVGAWVAIGATVIRSLYSTCRYVESEPNPCRYGLYSGVSSVARIQAMLSNVPQRSTDAPPLKIRLSSAVAQAATLVRRYAPPYARVGRCDEAKLV